ncbi:hypothetical protein GCM10009540_20600 [Streptomyces turgidiscabies]
MSQSTWSPAGTSCEGAAGEIVGETVEEAEDAAWAEPEAQTEPSTRVGDPIAPRRGRLIRMGSVAPAGLEWWE